MKVTITPGNINGTIYAPASKSSMQRACAVALVSKKKCIINNPGKSNDDKAALSIIENLGAKIEQQADGSIIISSTENNSVAGSEINCGESGLSIRMFTPIAALKNNTLSITGSGSLTTRPMDFFDAILPQLAVQIESDNGKLPLKVTGPLVPANIEVDGSLSSQYLTGLLLAYTAAEADAVSIKVNNLKSKPYIDLTLDVMKQFGLPIPKNNNYESFDFSSNHKTQSSEVTYTVEGDWSGGAFLLVAGAIAGNIFVQGLDMMSSQADKKITEALVNAGAAIAFEAKGFKVHQNSMQAFEFDANDCPDLFPPLVALAAYCKGITKIKGISRLTHKESNRAITLQQEFGKMNVQIDLEDDYMYVHGGSKVKGSNVSSHHDHRIAMACAIAALQADGETIIEDAEAINKSYPDFYLHLKKLNANVSLFNLNSLISE